MRRLSLVVIVFVASRCAILFAFDPESWDTGIYFNDAHGVARGERPYTAERPFEYPPVALWAIRLPFAIARRPPNLGQYRHAFRLEMALCDAAAFALVIAIARRRRPDRVVAVAATYTVATGLLANVLYDRLDAGLLALVLAWAYAFLRSPGSRAWTAVAYAALGLGVSYKLVPAVIVPVLAAFELRHRRAAGEGEGQAEGDVRGEAAANRRSEDRHRLAVALAAGGIAALAPFALHPGAIEVLRIHSIRGVQIESLWASIASLAGQLGAHLVVAPSYGSFNLVGTIADVFKVASAVAVVGLVAAMAVVAWRRRGDHLDAYRLACATLACAVIASNVLSPQYFVWALPMTCLLAAEVAPERFSIAAGAVVAIAALTAWVFPSHYMGDLVPAVYPAPLPATLATLAIAARNLAYLALAGWLTCAACSQTSSRRRLANQPWQDG